MYLVLHPEGKTEDEIAFEGIASLRAFWTSIGAPETLADYDIDDSKLELMAEKATVNGPLGNFSNLNKDDVLVDFKSFIIRELKNVTLELSPCVTFFVIQVTLN